jgi:peroxiredoxin
MTISVGDRIPSSTLVKVTADGPDQIDTDGFFAGRTVPTCSAKHLPGFVAQADALKAKGVDEIACTAVNDAFVLAAWAKATEAEGVTMLADGNGDFAKALGLTMDGSKFGMGTRSQRYAMLVEDGVVKQLHVEAPGEFKVSTAEHLLAGM